MTFWGNLRKRITGRPREERTAAAHSSSLKSPSDLLIDVFGGKTASGATVSAESAMTVSTVYACVRILAEGIAMLPLKLYRRTANGREEEADHPLYALLKDSPNENQTSFEWREMMQGHLCLRGNAYSRIVRDQFFDVKAIVPLHPATVQVQQLPSGANVYRVDGGRDLLTSADILHFRGLSNNGSVGLSPLSLMRETIGLALTIQSFGAKSFANGNKFPGILKTPASLQEKQLTSLRAAWDAQRAGDNSSKVPILHGGLDWVSVGMNNSDAELIASGVFTRQDIAEAFRVPLVMLAHGEKSATYASVEQFMLSFVNQTLQPWLERWEQRMNASLLSTADQAEGLYFKFNLRALLRGDAKSRAEFYRLMREIRAMTINEIRTAEDMNDFPDNIGDNPREDFNGQGGKAPSAAAPAESDEDTEEDSTETASRKRRQSVVIERDERGDIKTLTKITE